MHSLARRRSAEVLGPEPALHLPTLRVPQPVEVGRGLQRRPLVQHATLRHQNHAVSLQAQVW